MSNDINKIEVSVVIPAYNEENFLPACLESLARQDFNKNFEIIVVDNNSTDKTGSVAKSYGVKVVKETQQGICFARQHGTEIAKGRIVISTDADCVLPSDWLRNIYDSFDKNPGLIAAIGPFQFTPLPKWGRWCSTVLFKIVNRFYGRTGKILYTPASNFAFDKEAWLRIGGYNTALAQGGDEKDLFSRLRKKGKAVYLPNNTVLTSSRRLAKGFIYTLFISLIGFYLLDYYVATKLTGRSMTGHYPAYREHYEQGKKSWSTILSSVVTVFLLSLLAIGVVFTVSPAKARDLTVSSSQKVFSLVIKNPSARKMFRLRHFHRVNHRTAYD